VLPAKKKRTISATLNTERTPVLLAALSELMYKGFFALEKECFLYLLQTLMVQGFFSLKKGMFSIFAADQKSSVLFDCVVSLGNVLCI